MFVTEAQNFPVPVGPSAIGPQGELVDLLGLVESAREYAADAKAPRTRDAYAKQWKRFVAWAEAHALTPLPADPRVVALYITSAAEQGLKPASIALGLAAITAMHRERNLPTPCTDTVVVRVREGVRRRHGVAQDGKAPIDLDDLRAMVRTLPDTKLGKRDRALLLVGYAGAFRRSELVDLEVRDLRFVNAGLEVLVRKSKTDQVGAGRLKVIARGSRPSTCPVTSLQEWLRVAEIAEGPVFRSVDRHGRIGTVALSGHAVATTVKRAATRVGLDAAALSAHSLRVGFVTNAKLRGASDAAVMDQTGHKSLEMVRRYTRRTDAWNGAASGQLGL